MRKLVILPVIMMLAGCATKEMKTTPFYEGTDITYTGRPEDRVNLWPLAYWREPAGSVLWPMFSFSDDHFAFRPIYSRYGEDQSFLWPIGQYDSKTRQGHLLPLFWGDDYFDLFPILWNHQDRHLLLPLAYYREKSYLAICPLLWWDIAEDSLTLLPVFGHSKERDWLFPLYYSDDDITLVTPLAGVNRRYGSRWLAPLLYWDNDEVVTPLWWQTFDRMTGEPDSWLVPPLLTGGGVSESGASYFFCPLGGYDDERNGVFPLWYRNSSGFYTLPYCQWEDRGRVTSFVPPLMSWHESSNDGSSRTCLLMGLYGHDVKPGGGATQDWLAPLYYYGGHGDFQTLLFGRSTKFRSADYWWLTPLVGTTTGDTVGFWFAPLVSWSCGNGISRLESMMDADRLDASVVETYNKTVKQDKSGCHTNEAFCVKSENASEELQFGLGMLEYSRDIDLEGGENCALKGKWRYSSFRKLAGKRWRQGKDKTVAFYDKSEFGFRLLFGGERQRVVNFDYDTKEKVFDGEVDETDSLYGLVWSSRSERFGGRSNAERSLFWRLYHQAEKDGDSTTDIFPFITHDSKSDGYVKTSFLWRLFRYERNPGKGTAVDLLFVPVWR